MRHVKTKKRSSIMKQLTFGRILVTIGVFSLLIIASYSFLTFPQSAEEFGNSYYEKPIFLNYQPVTVANKKEALQRWSAIRNSYLSNNYEEALRSIEQFKALVPDAPLSKYYEAVCLLELDEKEKALSVIDEIDLYPELNGRALWLKGLIQLQMNRLEDAISTIERMKGNRSIDLRLRNEAFHMLKKLKKL